MTWPYVGPSSSDLRRMSGSTNLDGMSRVNSAVRMKIALDRGSKREGLEADLARLMGMMNTWEKNEYLKRIDC